MLDFQPPTGMAGPSGLARRSLGTRRCIGPVHQAPRRHALAERSPPYPKIAASDPVAKGPMDASEFVERMKSGDARVFDDLYPLIRRICNAACSARSVRDADFRQDVAQDVSLKIFRKWQSFDGRSKLGSWIYAIAQNHLLDLLRSQQVERGVFASPATVMPADESPEESHPAAGHPDGRVSEEQRLCIQRMLEEMSHEPEPTDGGLRKWDIIQWWVLNSPSSEELAAYLRKAPGAAREQKSQILKYVRQLCVKHCGSPNCLLTGGH